MRRAFLLIPLLLACLVGLARGAARLAGYALAPRELAVAGAVAAVASDLALLPLLATRGRSQATVSQAALAGTVIQLLAAVALGFGASSALHAGQPFLYCLLGFYWISLLVICVVAIRAVKAAPVHTLPEPTPSV